MKKAGETALKVPKPKPEPRWPALIAILIAGGLYASLDKSLAIGPRWLLLCIIVALAIPNIIAHHRQYHTVNTILGYMNESVMTIFLSGSVIALVCALLYKRIAPADLLRSAAILWICNVVLFALWYWRLDAGGPYERHKRGHHQQGAFLFPPMTRDGEKAAPGPWSPRFIDYLFLSFNTSTALSPTDTPVLSRWAKLLCIVQAIISLTLVVVLVGRAVNLL